VSTEALFGLRLLPARRLFCALEGSEIPNNGLDISEAAPQALGDNVVCLHTHVAETDAAARKEASGPFDLYVETRLYAKKMVYDDILRSGIHLFGSVETVTKKLCALADMRVDHVMTMQNFGNMAPADVTNSMRLLAERVMPQVRQRQASRSLRGVA